MFPIACLANFQTRRSGSAPPTPMPVAGMSLWLSDTGSSAGVWPDLSGNGNDAVQATVASQPSVVANALNGRQGRLFDGVNDYFNLTTSFYPGSNWTAFHVVKSASMDALMIGLCSSSGDPYSLLCFTDGNTYASNNSIFAVGSYGLTDANIWTIKNQSDSFTIYRNGVLFSITQNLNGNSGIWSLLGASISQGRYSNGYHFEDIIYGTAESDADRQFNQSYLGTKWGIALGQPQITLVDFNGLTGANFVTATAGLGWIFIRYDGLKFGIWYNTGTESQPDFSAHGPIADYIQISINPTSTASDIATATLAVSSVGGVSTAVVNGGGTNTACQCTATVNATQTSCFDVNSGATITTTQAGSPNS